MISYLIGFCFLLLPFVKFSFSYDSSEYPKVILFIIIFNTVLALKLWTIFNNSKKYLKSNLIDKLLILLVVLLLISWGVNGFPPVSLWGQYYRYEGLVTLMAYLSFYFLISRFSEPRIIHLFVCLSAFVVSSYIFVYGLLFKVANLIVPTFNGRIAGTLGNPNFTAGFLALSYPYLLFYPKLKSIYKIIITPIFFLALIFTQSRSGLLAFLVVIVLFLLKKYKYGLIAAIPITFFLLAVLMTAIPRYSPVENQMAIWKKAVVAINQKPLFGWGVERFEVAFKNTLIPGKDFDFYNVRVDKAHNEVLEYGVVGGIPTMIVYISLLMTSLFFLFKGRNSIWYEANLFALVAYLVLSQLNVLNITEYIFLFLILASVYHKKVKD